MTIIWIRQVASSWFETTLLNQPWTSVSHVIKPQPTWSTMRCQSCPLYLMMFQTISVAYAYKATSFFLFLLSIRLRERVMCATDLKHFNWTLISQWVSHIGWYFWCWCWLLAVKVNWRRVLQLSFSFSFFKPCVYDATDSTSYMNHVDIQYMCVYLFLYQCFKPIYFQSTIHAVY